MSKKVKSTINVSEIVLQQSLDSTDGVDCARRRRVSERGDTTLPSVLQLPTTVASGMLLFVDPLATKYVVQEVLAGLDMVQLAVG
eukprot:3660173-Amphidinium_carterae.1